MIADLPPLQTEHRYLQHADRGDSRSQCRARPVEHAANGTPLFVNAYGNLRYGVVSAAIHTYYVAFGAVTLLYITRRAFNNVDKDDMLLTECLALVRPNSFKFIYVKYENWVMRHMMFLIITGWCWIRIDGIINVVKGRKRSCGSYRTQARPRDLLHSLLVVYYVVSLFWC